MEHPPIQCLPTLSFARKLQKPRRPPSDEHKGAEQFLALFQLIFHPPRRREKILNRTGRVEYRSRQTRTIIHERAAKGMKDVSCLTLITEIDFHWCAVLSMPAKIESMRHRFVNCDASPKLRASGSGVPGRNKVEELPISGANSRPRGNRSIHHRVLVLRPSERSRRCLLR